MRMNESVKTVVAQLISRIREMPDGAQTSTARLIDDIGYRFGGRDFRLFEIHAALFKAAEAENIYLDMSSHEGLVEGLPYDLVFSIYHDTKT